MNARLFTMFAETGSVSMTEGHIIASVKLATRRI